VGGSTFGACGRTGAAAAQKLRQSAGAATRAATPALIMEESMLTSQAISIELAISFLRSSQSRVNRIINLRQLTASAHSPGEPKAHHSRTTASPEGSPHSFCLLKQYKPALEAFKKMAGALKNT